MFYLMCVFCNFDDVCFVCGWNRVTRILCFFSLESLLQSQRSQRFFEREKRFFFATMLRRFSVHMCASATRCIAHTQTHKKINLKKIYIASVLVMINEAFLFILHHSHHSYSINAERRQPHSACTAAAAITNTILHLSCPNPF